MLEPIELTGLLSCASRIRQLLMCRISCARLSLTRLSLTRLSLTRLSCTGLSCPGLALGSGPSGSRPLKPNRTAHGKWQIAGLANKVLGQPWRRKAMWPNRPGSRTAHAAVALGRIGRRCLSMFAGSMFAWSVFAGSVLVGCAASGSAPSERQPCIKRIARLRRVLGGAIASRAAVSTAPFPMAWSSAISGLGATRSSRQQCRSTSHLRERQKVEVKSQGLKPHPVSPLRRRRASPSV